VSRAKRIRGVAITDALRYDDANDPAFPGVDRQRHGREGASALDARRCLGSSASGATIDGEGQGSAHRAGDGVPIGAPSGRGARPAASVKAIWPASLPAIHQAEHNLGRDTRDDDNSGSEFEKSPIQSEPHLATSRKWRFPTFMPRVANSR
jgi:hypothetical protein